VHDVSTFRKNKKKNAGGGGESMAGMIAKLLGHVVRSKMSSARARHQTLLPISPIRSACRVGVRSTGCRHLSRPVSESSQTAHIGCAGPERRGAVAGHRTSWPGWCLRESGSAWSAASSARKSSTPRRPRWRRGQAVVARDHHRYECPFLPQSFGDALLEPPLTILSSSRPARAEPPRFSAKAAAGAAPRNVVGQTVHRLV